MIHLPKSQPAPACLEAEKLKANGNHNCGDVLERLKTDFKNKCYICEEGYITSINTEHFVPHRGDVELKLNWDNLFFSCVHCNNVKSDRIEFDNILNCTREADGVDTKIKYWIEPFAMDRVIITAIENDPKVNNTVVLLDMVYNGTTPLKKIESNNLRSKLLTELRNFNELLLDTKLFPSNQTIKQKIIDHLKPASHFTAFKRWIVRDDETLYGQFHEYL